MEIFSILQKIPRNLYIHLIIGSLGVIFLVYGLIYLLGNNQSRENITFDQASQGKSQDLSPTLAAQKEIVVDIEGAVLNPGVYHLSQDSRMQDLLIKAGGLSAKADRDAVAKRINLAVRLTDGAKIYIPVVGESFDKAQDKQVQGVSSQISDSSTSLISINDANEEALDSLPGVGKVTANKIIQARPYSSLDELTSKKIVSTKVFEQIKNLISI